MPEIAGGGVPTQVADTVKAPRSLVPARPIRASTALLVAVVVTVSVAVPTALMLADWFVKAPVFAFDTYRYAVKPFVDASCVGASVRTVIRMTSPSSKS